MVGPLRLAPTLPPAADGLQMVKSTWSSHAQDLASQYERFWHGEAIWSLPSPMSLRGGAKSIAVHKPSGTAEAARVEALQLRHGGHQDRSFPAVRRHIRSQAALSSQPVQETLQDAASHDAPAGVGRVLGPAGDDLPGRAPVLIEPSVQAAVRLYVVVPVAQASWHAFSLSDSLAPCCHSDAPGSTSIKDGGSPCSHVFCRVHLFPLGYFGTSLFPSYIISPLFGLSHARACLGNWYMRGCCGGLSL